MYLTTKKTLPWAKWTQELDSFFLLIAIANKISDISRVWSGGTRGLPSPQTVGDDAASSKYSFLLQYCILPFACSHCIPLRHRALIQFGVIASFGGRHLSANCCKSRNCTDGIQVSRLHLLQLEICCFALDWLWIALGSLNDVVDFFSRVIVYHTHLIPKALAVLQFGVIAPQTVPKSRQWRILWRS